MEPFIVTDITERKRAEADLTRQPSAFARKQTIAPNVLDVNDAVPSMHQDAATPDR